MSKYYNIVKSRYELNGDGTGLQRAKWLLPSAPAGTNQAIYAIRMSTSYNADYSETVTGDSAIFHGLSFDGVYPTTLQPETAQYDNFFGPAGSDSSSPYSSFSFKDNAGNDTFEYGNVASSAHLYDANGSYIDNTSPLEKSVSLDNSSTRVSNLALWVIETDLATNAVHYDLLWSNDDIDLSIANLETDIDSDDPSNSFSNQPGVAFSSDYSGQLHGDVTGTNWRPSDGVMAFPTHFMTSNPSRTLQWAVHYVGVKYSTLTL